MFKVSFSDFLAVAGIVFGIILVVLDKAGKLKGPTLFVLLAVAAAMMIPLAIGNSWVSDAPSYALKIFRGAFLISIIGCLYAATSARIAKGVAESSRGVENAGNLPEVTIKPSEVTFGAVPASAPDTMSDTYMFRITNNTNEDLYSVTFKLRVESQILSVSDFRFDVPKSSQKPIDENDPVGQQFGDITGMECTDTRGRPVFFRVILQLAPNESRQISLTRINPSASSVPAGQLPNQVILPDQSSPSAVTVRAEVSYFTKTPLPRLSGQAILLRPFYLDEKLTCNAMSYIRLK